MLATSCHGKHVPFPVGFLLSEMVRNSQNLLPAIRQALLLLVPVQQMEFEVHLEPPSRDMPRHKTQRKRPRTSNLESCILFNTFSLQLE